MGENISSRRPSRGTVWRKLKAGDSFGRPLAEWAHVTPRFPNGISNSTLRTASTAVQQETALVWFLANLKPYDLSGNGPYGALNYAPGPYAPSPARAFHALDGEFKGVLPEQLILSIGSTLGNNWMWIDEPPFERPQPENKGQFEVALLKALAQLSANIERLYTPHGGIGHNHPPNDVPLSPDEQAEALQTIEEVKAAIKDPPKMKKAWSALQPALLKIGAWSVAQIATFSEGLMYHLLRR